MLGKNLMLSQKPQQYLLCIQYSIFQHQVDSGQCRTADVGRLSML